MELVNAAENASGASAEQFEKTQDSLENKMNRLKDSWQEFLMNLANSDIIKGAVDGLNKLLEIINKITSATGSEAIKTLSSWGAAAGMFFGAKKALGFSNNGIFKGLIKGLTKINGGEQLTGLPKLINFISTYPSKAEKAAQASNALGSAMANVGTQAEVGAAGTGSFVKGLLRIALAHPIVAGAIIAITAATIGLYQAWKHTGDNALERQIEDFSDAMDYFKEQTEETEQKINDLDSALSSLAEQRENIDNLALGTDAWRESVSALNNEILSLIQQFPQLAQYLQTNNGIMSIPEERIREVKNNYQKSLEEQQIALSYGQILAQYGREQVENVDRKELINAAYGSGAKRYFRDVTTISGLSALGAGTIATGGGATIGGILGGIAGGAEGIAGSAALGAAGVAATPVVAGLLIAGGALAGGKAIADALQTKDDILDLGKSKHLEEINKISPNQYSSFEEALAHRDQWYGQLAEDNQTREFIDYYDKIYAQKTAYNNTAKTQFANLNQAYLSTKGLDENRAKLAGIIAGFATDPNDMMEQTFKDYGMAHGISEAKGGNGSIDTANGGREDLAKLINKINEYARAHNQGTYTFTGDKIINDLTGEEEKIDYVGSAKEGKITDEQLINKYIAIRVAQQYQKMAEDFGEETKKLTDNEISLLVGDTSKQNYIEAIDTLTMKGDQLSQDFKDYIIDQAKIMDNFSPDKRESDFHEALEIYKENFNKVVQGQINYINALASQQDISKIEGELDTDAENLIAYQVQVNDEVLKQLSPERRTDLHNILQNSYNDFGEEAQQYIIDNYVTPYLEAADSLKNRQNAMSKMASLGWLEINEEGLSRLKDSSADTLLNAGIAAINEHYSEYFYNKSQEGKVGNIDLKNRKIYTPKEGVYETTHTSISDYFSFSGGKEAYAFLYTPLYESKQGEITELTQEQVDSYFMGLNGMFEQALDEGLTVTDAAEKVMDYDKEQGRNILFGLTKDLEDSVLGELMHEIQDPYYSAAGYAASGGFDELDRFRQFYNNLGSSAIKQYQGLQNAINNPQIFDEDLREFSKIAISTQNLTSRMIEEIVNDSSNWSNTLNAALAATAENGRLTADQLKEIAKDNKTLSDAFETGKIHAGAFARMLEDVNNGLLTQADLLPSVVELYNNLYSSASLVEEALDRFNSHNISSSGLELGSNYKKSWDAVKEILDRGGYGDPALGDYMRQMIGDEGWNTLLMQNGNSQYSAMQAAQKQYGLQYNNESLRGSILHMINNSKEKWPLSRKGNQIHWDLSGISSAEEFATEIAKQFGISYEYAQNIVADMSTFSKDLSSQLSGLTRVEATENYLNEHLGTGEYDTTLFADRASMLAMASSFHTDLSGYEDILRSQVSLDNNDNKRITDIKYGQRIAGNFFRETDEEGKYNSKTYYLGTSKPLFDMGITTSEVPLSWATDGSEKNSPLFKGKLKESVENGNLLNRYSRAASSASRDYKHEPMTYKNSEGETYQAVFGRDGRIYSLGETEKVELESLDAQTAFDNEKAGEERRGLRYNADYQQMMMSGLDEQGRIDAIKSMFEDKVGEHGSGAEIELPVGVKLDSTEYEQFVAGLASEENIATVTADVQTDEALTEVAATLQAVANILNEAEFHVPIQITPPSGFTMEAKDENEKVIGSYTFGVADAGKPGEVVIGGKGTGYVGAEGTKNEGKSITLNQTKAYTTAQDNIQGRKERAKLAAENEKGKNGDTTYKDLAGSGGGGGGGGSDDKETSFTDKEAKAINEELEKEDQSNRISNAVMNGVNAALDPYSTGVTAIEQAGVGDYIGARNTINEALQNSDETNYIEEITTAIQDGTGSVRDAIQELKETGTISDETLKKLPGSINGAETSGALSDYSIETVAAVANDQQEKFNQELEVSNKRLERLKRLEQSFGKSQAATLALQVLQTAEMVKQFKTTKQKFDYNRKAFFEERDKFNKENKYKDYVQYDDMGNKKYTDKYWNSGTETRKKVGEDKGVQGMDILAGNYSESISGLLEGGLGIFDMGMSIFETGKGMFDTVKGYAEKIAQYITQAIEVVVSAWTNRKDWLYNFLNRIEKELHEFEKLQEYANQIDEGRVVSYQELMQNWDDQFESLQKQLEMQNERVESRQQYLDWSKFIPFTLISGWSPVTDTLYENRTVKMIWDIMIGLGKTLPMFGDVFGSLDELYKDYDKRVQENYEDRLEAEKAILEIESERLKLVKAGAEEATQFEEKVMDAFIQKEQEAIDELSRLNESITGANQTLIDTLKDNLEQVRRIRENTDKEEDLTDKEQRLAYLRQDTSNANLNEIKKLEKDLEDEHESYTDKLIDQRIDDLSKQNEDAAAQRQKQIELLQGQLDWAQKYGIYWDHIYGMLYTVDEYGNIGLNQENFDERGFLRANGELSKMLNTFSDLIGESIWKTLMDNEDLKKLGVYYNAFIQYNGNEGIWRRQDMLQNPDINDDGYVSWWADKNAGPFWQFFAKIEDDWHDFWMNNDLGLWNDTALDLKKVADFFLKIWGWITGQSFESRADAWIKEGGFKPEHDNTPITEFFFRATRGMLFNRAANGTDDATTGKWLVGEEGPELIQFKNGGAYLAGTRGPEMVPLSNGDKVYNNSDTKNIFGGPSFGRLASGNAEPVFVNPSWIEDLVERGIKQIGNLTKVKAENDRNIVNEVHINIDNMSGKEEDAEYVAQVVLEKLDEASRYRSTNYIDHPMR